MLDARIKFAEAIERSRVSENRVATEEVGEGDGAREAGGQGESV